MTKQEYVDLITDFGMTFSTESGQRVLQFWREDILENISFDHTNPNAELTAWREGQRYFLIDILEKLKHFHNPSIVTQLFGEEEESSHNYL